MKIITTFFAITLLLVLASCTQRNSVSAVIRVTQISPPQSDEHLRNVVIQVLSSFDYSLHANQALGLSKIWGLDEIQAAEKIHKALKIQPGNEPDLFEVSITGLEHNLAVAIVNDLCTNYCAYAVSMPVSDTVRGDYSIKQKVTFVKFPQ